MTYQDQTLTCRDCGKQFVFTARDQQFYAEKGFTNLPTRCKDCRLNKKKVAEQKATQVLYKITCKKCGKVGEMATEPRKPDDVYCTACFYEEFKAKHPEFLAQAQAKHVAETAGSSTREEAVDGISPSEE